MVKIVVIIGILIYGYIYINNNLIKPYQERVDFVDDKIDSVVDYVTDKWEGLEKYNPFN